MRSCFVALLLFTVGCAVPTAAVHQLPVSVGRGLVHTLDDQLVQAADAWNNAVGQQLLVLTDDTNPNVFLTAMSLQSPDYVAITYSRWSSKGRREGFVTLRQDLLDSQDVRWQVSVLEHELGHVLGLRHEPDPHSIMYYAASPTGEISATSIKTLYEQYDYYLEN